MLVALQEERNQSGARRQSQGEGGETNEAGREAPRQLLGGQDSHGHSQQRYLASRRRSRKERTSLTSPKPKDVASPLGDEISAVTERGAGGGALVSLSRRRLQVSDQDD